MENVLFVDGRKFMWDGRTHESQESALAAGKAYQGDGFETHVCDDQGRYLVYTRRLAAPSTAEPSPGS
jgi:hypothetical protein